MHRRGTAVLLLALAANAGFAACAANGDAIGPEDVAGSWTGFTSQDKAMLLTVTSAGVSHATFTYVLQGARCGYTSTLQIPTIQAMVISGGRFTLARTQIGSSLFISATGEFASAAKAAGTFLVQDGQCGDTLSLTWSAARQ